jgi:hypothetical protein
MRQRVLATRISLVLALTALLTSTILVTEACHPPPTIVTPAGKVAYTKDEVVVRVNELENTVIEAAHTGGLPRAQAKVIVRFTVSADRAIKAPTWIAAVTSLWGDTKKALATMTPPITNPAVNTAIASVDIVLAALGGH